MGHKRNGRIREISSWICSTRMLSSATSCRNRAIFFRSPCDRRPVGATDLDHLPASDLDPHAGDQVGRDGDLEGRLFVASAHLVQEPSRAAASGRGGGEHVPQGGAPNIRPRGCARHSSSGWRASCSSCAVSRRNPSSARPSVAQPVLGPRDARREHVHLAGACGAFRLPARIFSLVARSCFWLASAPGVPGSAPRGPPPTPGPRGGIRA